MPTDSRHLFSRRDFFSKAIGAAVILIPAVYGCDGKKDGKTTENAPGEPIDCSDLTGVSREDLAIREKLAYVEESPISDNQCENCNLYLPPSAGKKCGGCMLFKGPVKAEGYCTYWAPKV